MNRGMVPQRSPMGGSGDWGMSRSSASPVGSAGHPSMMRPGMEYNNGKGMMSGPMVSRSNSVPGTRSMLQQQLMEMGTSVILLPGVDGVDSLTENVCTLIRITYFYLFF